MADNDVTMVSPKFRISLTAQQTLEVGRLSVIWGQIDHLTLQTVTLLLARDLSAGVALLGEMATGPLVNLLNKSRHRIVDKEIRALTKTYCEEMGPLIKTRNHVVHGIWGWHLPGKDIKKAKRGCFFSKDPFNPVFPEKVTEVANRAAEQTHVITRIYYHLADQPFPKDQPKLLFGQHMPKIPKGTRLVPHAQRLMGRQN